MVSIPYSASTSAVASARVVRPSPRSELVMPSVVRLLTPSVWIAWRTPSNMSSATRVPPSAAGVRTYGDGDGDGDGDGSHDGCTRGLAYSEAGQAGAAAAGLETFLASSIPIRISPIVESIRAPEAQPSAELRLLCGSWYRAGRAGRP